MKLIRKDQICAFNIHYAYYSLEYCLNSLEKLGVTKVELLAGHPGLWLDHRGFEDTRPIRRMLADRHIQCPVITPENCEFAYQYGAPEKEQFERSFQYFANGIRMGAELGAKILMANSGWGYWNEPFDDGIKRAAEMHSRLCEVAEEYDMYIACESLRPQESLIGETLGKVKTLFDMVNHPRFKAMVDLTAMAVSGESIQEWFDVFGTENIIHAHFVDGNPYGHLVWGEGNRNLQKDLEVMLANGYQGVYSQELTDASYFADPYDVDKRNVWRLFQYAE